MGVFTLRAQSYDALWKSVSNAQMDGQPVTAQGSLQKIIKKAERDGNFAQLLAACMEMAQCRSDIDPDSIVTDVEAMEKKFANRSDATERAVVHAALGSIYEEMSHSWRFAFDRGATGAFIVKKEEHYSHVLDDLKSLAMAKAEKYKPLAILNKDGKIFNHDMLAVMVAFADEHCDFSFDAMSKMRKEAAAVYAELGNREGEAMMLMHALSNRDELHDLLMRSLDLNVGMDIAYKYYSHVVNADEEKKDTLLNPYPAEYAYKNSTSDQLDANLRFIRWAREHVKMSDAWSNLHNKMKEIERATLYIQNSDAVFADSDIKLSIDYNNRKSLKLEVRKYNGTTLKNNVAMLRTDGELVLNRELTLGDDAVNIAREKANLPVRGIRETTLNLPPGHYVVIAGTGFVEELHLTSMRMIEMGIERGKSAVYVVDAHTGRPVKGVKVIGTKRNELQPEESVTNQLGIAYISTKDVNAIKAIKSEDDWTESLYPGRFNEAESRSKQTYGKIYTDRAIYRPGQKVKGNVLVYSMNGDEAKVAKSAATRVELIDPARKHTQALSVVTNEYGTADFEFTLPDDAEVGSYALNLKADGVLFYSQVRVEEYKRPTFEVKFDQADNSNQKFSIDEKIDVTGKAMLFSGAPVQGGKVKCLIHCGTTSFWWWRQPNWTKMAEVDLTTADDGSFTVPLTLSDSLITDDDEYSDVCVFRVQATVTDQSGETREGEWSIRVSHREFALNVECDANVDMDTHPFVKAVAKNANGDDVDVEGEYSIKRNGSTVAKGTFRSNADISIPDSLKFGKYTIELSSRDSKSHDIHASQSFWLMHSKIKAVDIHTVGTKDVTTVAASAEGRGGEEFVYAPDADFSEAKPAKLYFAPLKHNAYVYYNVFAGDKLMDSSQAVLSNDLHCITIPYRKEYGEGVLVQMFYVQNGHLGTMTQSFTYVQPEPELTLTWSTFRDKLQPGQQEEWTLSIKDAKGKAVNGAEMMAVMYDAALDRILRHRWNMSLNYSRSVPYTYAHSTGNAHFPNFSLLEHVSLSSQFTRRYDYLTLFVHNQFIDESRHLETFMVGAAPGLMAEHVEDRVVVSKSRAMAAAPMAMKASVMNGNAEETEQLDAEVDTQAFSNAKVRSDFAETAFFMPHLVSDSKGDVHIAFQLPESLTEWKFFALAHTADMNYGLMSQTVVARKEFMVRPNMPRFVRWGDKASIVSSIINQCEKEVKGTVRMRMLNPVTGEEVLVMHQPFAVEANKTASVEFEFDVLDTYEGMDCEIIAVSGDTSDGEKNHLPVLSTKKEMVETVPFYIYDTDEVTLDLSALFNNNSATATNRQLSIDYTDTPAWMCIEALRSVKTPATEDAISYASSMYADNRIVALIDSFPMLREYEDQETVRAHYASSRDKLRALQQPDGGWSWFRGMHSNYYVTLSVCEQLAMLRQRTAAEEAMLQDGLKYMDQVSLSAYRSDKKLKHKIMPSNSTLRYLYVCSLVAERPLSKDVQKMHKEYLTALNKCIGDLTMFGIANASCALRAFGYEKIADKYVESLKQHTVTKPGLGRFFATDAAYYSWRDYRLPTQTAAMRALYAKDSRDPYLLDMQLWLIAQKQVQKWDSPMNTIDVADLLLSISPAASFRKASVPSITLDGTRLTDLRTGTLNTERDALEGRKSNLSQQGNIIAEASKEQAANGVRTLTVARDTHPHSSTDDDELQTAGLGISWGFAQATFLEEIGNLNSYATAELSVSRQLFVSRSGEWVEIGNNDELCVGDKVRVRQIVTADRDMDFVRLNAQHPACFEPVSTRSGYQWLGTRSGYVSLHDSNCEVYFDSFTRGTTTIDLDFFVNRTGTYQLGISTVECAYAKQFGGHTSGCTVVVK